MIKKDVSHSIDTNEFQLSCTDAGEGSIQPWESAREIEEEYVRQAEIIREYASHGLLLPDVSEAEVYKAMRPFLESYILSRVPGQFGEREMLYDMTSAIEVAGVDHPLFQSIQDLYALNEYTRGGMHGGATALNPDELRAQCKKIVRIIGMY